MTHRTATQDLIDELARDPLRHVVLLKQLLAYPEHVTVHRVAGTTGTATLVALDVSVSAYDRQAYPKAAVAAFISSDHPELTASLLSRLPRGVGIVFKLSREADLVPVQSQFKVERRTAFVSFTADRVSEADPGVRTTHAPATRRCGCSKPKVTSGPGSSRCCATAGLLPVCWSGTRRRYRRALRSRVSARCGRWAAWSPTPRSAAGASGRASSAPLLPSLPFEDWRRAIRSRRTTPRRSPLPGPSALSHS
jgi:hypothetical protein